MSHVAISIEGAIAPISINRSDLADGTHLVSIQVPDDLRLTEPIRIVLEGMHDQMKTKVIVSVGQRAHVFIAEELRGDRAWHHSCEITVGAESEVEYVSAQLTGPGAQLTISQRSTVGEGGSVTWHNATLGGNQVDQNVESRVIGGNATSTVNWLFYVKDSEKQSLRVRNIFDARDGGGEVTMQGVAEDKGHADCEGLIDIGLQGGGTNTYLTQQVLMLDATAKVDAIPGLEIKTNDVKASHSATVARVTEEDLFYFASRGIPKDMARGMFIRGFLGSLADRISDAQTRDMLNDAIMAKYEREKR